MLEDLTKTILFIVFNEAFMFLFFFFIVAILTFKF